MAVVERVDRRGEVARAERHPTSTDLGAGVDSAWENWSLPPLMFTRGLGVTFTSHLFPKVNSLLTFGFLTVTCRGRD